MKDPPIGEAAWAHAVTDQSGREGVFSLPHSTSPRPLAWPYKPHFPVWSFSTNKDDALVSPCKLFCYISDGCIYWTPLSPSTVLLQRTEEFQRPGDGSKFRIQRLIWRGYLKCKFLRPRPINSDGSRPEEGLTNLYLGQLQLNQNHILRKPWGLSLKNTVC